MCVWRAGCCEVFVGLWLTGTASEGMTLVIHGVYATVLWWRMETLLLAAFR